MQKYPQYWKGHYCDQDEDQNFFIIHLQFSEFSITKEGDQSKVSGKGKDQNGDFTFEGKIQNNKNLTATFKSNNKKYKEMVVKGELNNDGVMEGMWGPTEEQVGMGNFNLQKIQISQGWNGHFEQGDIHYQMKFDNLKVDSVPNGKVEGKGKDDCGAFCLKGNYDPSKNEISFKKIYTEGDNKDVQWTYWGTLKDQELVGKWGFQKGDEQGNFKLKYHS